mmetsp:Transcript_6310/g.10473  ORF Transcript_6310/g.10473 Transcript_6310/m.10473 type:complete len:198 (+) Transcript_6310:62-655(+)
MEPLWGRFGLLLCTLLVILAPSSLANFIEVNNFEVGCQEADLNEIQSYEECVLAAHALNWESKNVTVRSDDGPANCYHNHDVGATFKADNVPTGNCDYDCACKQQSTTTPTTTPSLSTGNPAVQVLMPSSISPTAIVVPTASSPSVESPSTPSSFPVTSPSDATSPTSEILPTTSPTITIVGPAPPQSPTASPEINF